MKLLSLAFFSLGRKTGRLQHRWHRRGGCRGSLEWPGHPAVEVSWWKSRQKSAERPDEWGKIEEKFAGDLFFHSWSFHMFNPGEEKLNETPDEQLGSIVLELVGLKAKKRLDPGWSNICFSLDTHTETTTSIYRSNDIVVEYTGQLTILVYQFWVVLWGKKHGLKPKSYEVARQCVFQRVLRGRKANNFWMPKKTGVPRTRIIEEEDHMAQDRIYQNPQFCREEWEKDGNRWEKRYILSWTALSFSSKTHRFMMVLGFRAISWSVSVLRLRSEKNGTFTAEAPNSSPGGRPSRLCLWTWRTTEWRDGVEWVWKPSGGMWLSLSVRTGCQSQPVSSNSILKRQGTQDSSCDSSCFNRNLQDMTTTAMAMEATRTTAMVATKWTMACLRPQ